MMKLRFLGLEEVVGESHVTYEDSQVLRVIIDRENKNDSMHFK